jgi:hypothetical protein
VRSEAQFPFGKYKDIQGLSQAANGQTISLPISYCHNKWIRQKCLKNWQILLKHAKKGKSKKINNDLQNTKKTTQDCATRTPQNKTGSERMFSEKGSKQFLVQKSIHCLFSRKFRWIIMNEEMTGLWLRQAVHIRDNLRRIYYVSVN